MKRILIIAAVMTMVLSGCGNKSETDMPITVNLRYTGSGNSLAIARKIADKTGEQILPIYEAVRMDLSAEKRIGLVFPTYWLDAPLAIKALVPRLLLPKDAYTEREPVPPSGCEG